MKLIKFSNYNEVKEFINSQLINAKNYEDISYDLNILPFNNYIKYLELARKRYINKINYSLNYEKLYKLFLKYIRANSWILNQILVKESIDQSIEIQAKLKNMQEIIFKNFWCNAYEIFQKNNAN